MTNFATAEGGEDTLAGLLDPDGLFSGNRAAVPTGALANAGQVTDETAIRGGDTRDDGSKIESAWARAHPEGNADLEDDTLTLWNFDVGRSELKPRHQAALQELYKRYALRFMFRPPSLSGVVAGWASPTGIERSNHRLAAARAQSVIDWWNEKGLTALTAQSGIQDVGSDGESLARSRGVGLTLSAAPTTAEAQTPTTEPVSGITVYDPPESDDASTISPTKFEFAEPGVVEYECLSVEVARLEGNGVVEGKLTFKGKVRLVLADPTAVPKLQLGLKSDEASLKGTKDVFDWLRLVAEGKIKGPKLNDDGSHQKGKPLLTPVVALGLSIGPSDLKFDFGVQTDPYPIYLKLPSLPTPPLPVGTDDHPLRILGARVSSVQLIGQFEFACRPGKELAANVSEWGAGLGIGLAEAAIAAAGVAWLGVMVWMMARIGNGDVYAEASGALIASRYGFAAAIAAEVVDGATTADTDRFLSPYRDEPNIAKYQPVVVAAALQAHRQLKSLGDRKGERVAGLKATYAENRTFDAVANAIRVKLGDLQRDGGPPSIGML